MISIKYFFIFIIATLILTPALSNATAEKIHLPIYAGVTGGWGSTTWGKLVPENLNAALNISTPIKANESGSVWGLFIGYTLLPNFALEASYMHYPNATLYFDEMSLFAFDHDGLTKFNTRTERFGLVGKFQVCIPCTSFSAYSSVGAAQVHRDDLLRDKWKVNPLFGAGLIYNLNRNLAAELGTEYVAGYGQSELTPADHFVPFLYSVFLRLAYHFD